MQQFLLQSQSKMQRSLDNNQTWLRDAEQRRQMANSYSEQTLLDCKVDKRKANLAMLAKNYNLSRTVRKSQTPDVTQTDMKVRQIIDQQRRGAIRGVLDKLVARDDNFREHEVYGITVPKQQTVSTMTSIYLTGVGPKVNLT